MQQEPATLPVAIFTGGTHGVGRVTAKLLAASEWHVMAQGRSVEAGEALAAAHPGTVSFVPGDITDPAVVDRLVSLAEAADASPGWSTMPAAASAARSPSARPPTGTTCSPSTRAARSW